ncbi:beta 13 n galactosyltransferase [Echinococcus multilocularis]|uniref:Hexosyltransferase n=1 Tax=Echinococcus multilocularis TaxID=6211 RepID=A0A068XWQ3_ECHMU|nr:beta 13 n galactosyltransferase [Echinococcus multilocularis]
MNGSDRQLSFEELADIPDAEWLKEFDRSVYQLYPQSIPLRETLQAVINDKPVSQPPIFNPRIRFLQVPANVCSALTPEQAKSGLTGRSTHPNVVIVYKSGVYNFKERSHLRKLYNLSYTDINVSLIFSIGLPRTSLSNVFQRDGFNITLQNRSGNKLMAYLRSPFTTKKQLSLEMQEHDDLLVGDYEDSYYNLTLKLFHTFQWAARFCRLYKPIFVFLDDDYIVNPSKLTKFIRDLTPKLQENLNHGYEIIVNPVFRYSNPHSLWACSKREIPWPMHTPQYYGMYSMYSYHHVHDIALAMHFTKPLVLDDTWLGMVQYKLNLTFSRLKGMFREYSPLINHASCSDILFALLSEFERRQCVL